MHASTEFYIVKKSPLWFKRKLLLWNDRNSTKLSVTKTVQAYPCISLHIICVSYFLLQCAASCIMIMVWIWKIQPGAWLHLYTVKQAHCVPHTIRIAFMSGDKKQSYGKKAILWTFFVCVIWHVRGYAGVVIGIAVSAAANAAAAAYGLWAAASWQYCEFQNRFIDIPTAAAALTYSIANCFHCIVQSTYSAHVFVVIILIIPSLLLLLFLFVFFFFSTHPQMYTLHRHTSLPTMLTWIGMSHNLTHAHPHARTHTHTLAKSCCSVLCTHVYGEYRELYTRRTYTTASARVLVSHLPKPSKSSLHFYSQYVCTVHVL